MDWNEALAGITEDREATFADKVSRIVELVKEKVREDPTANHESEKTLALSAIDLLITRERSEEDKRERREQYDERVSKAIDDRLRIDRVVERLEKIEGGVKEVDRMCHHLLDRG